MKKIFTLIAVAVLAFAAQANTMTVAEGTSTNSHYPMYGLYYDTPGTMSQVIYPDYMLTDMVGMQITEIKFYTRETILLNGGMLEYSLKVVDQNEFVNSNSIELGEEDVCGHGTPVYGENIFVVTLDEPFQYDGGNLLLQILVTEKGNYQSLYFYGTETGLYGAYYQYMGWSGTWYGYTDAFLPKATFTYEEGQVTPPEPTEQTEAPSISADTQLGVHAYFVTITESEPSDLYYRYSKDDGEWSDWTLYDGSVAFDEDGYYQVEAYAIAPGKTESLHVGCSFVVTPRTGLDELSGDKAVAGVRFFNLAGQEMPEANGLTIVVTTYTDGTRTATKVIK